MKPKISILLNSILFIFIVTAFTSCEDSCTDTCDNGTCDLGICDCFTGWTGENCDELIYTGGGGSGGGNCNFTPYNGVQNCNDYGYVQVSSTTCCSSSYPYYNSSSGQCYTSCSAAYSAAPSGYITYGTGQTSGSSSGYDCSGSSCNYTSSNATYSSLSVCESYCGGSSGVGEVSFYTMSDLGCGNITVTISGYSPKLITNYYSSGINGCNSSGCANYNLSPGVYTYSASCSGGYTWGPASITITDGGCLKFKLQ